MTGDSADQSDSSLTQLDPKPEPEPNPTTSESYRASKNEETAASAGNNGEGENPDSKNKSVGEDTKGESGAEPSGERRPAETSKRAERNDSAETEEDEEEEDEDEGEDEDEDEDDEDEEDDEPTLKYARLTQHLRQVYRNGDATSSFLVAGDKMVCHALCRYLDAMPPIFRR